MDKLKAMQTFICIADQGSLTAAAHTTGSSLPAVVRTLAALEAHLGTRLFNRTTRRITLTAEGRQYLASCRNILASIDDAENALANESSEPSGPLSVTAPVLFGQMHVTPAITRFVQRYPKVRVSVMLYDHVVNLHEQGIDVGIRIGHLEDSSLIAQQIMTVNAHIVASPDYLRRDGTPKHPNDLRNANCIRFIGSIGNTEWVFHQDGRALTIPTRGNIEFNHITPAIDACVAGLGIGRFVSYQIATYLKQKQLRIILREFELPPRPVSIVYPHARLLPARTRLFIEWMKRELKDLKA